MLCRDFLHSCLEVLKRSVHLLVPPVSPLPCPSGDPAIASQLLHLLSSTSTSTASSGGGGPAASAAAAAAAAVQAYGSGIVWELAAAPAAAEQLLAAGAVAALLRVVADTAAVVVGDCSAGKKKKNKKQKGAASKTKKGSGDNKGSSTAAAAAAGSKGSKAGAGAGAASGAGGGSSSKASAGGGKACVQPPSTGFVLPLLQDPAAAAKVALCNATGQCVMCVSGVTGQLWCVLLRCVTCCCVHVKLIRHTHRHPLCKFPQLPFPPPLFSPCTNTRYTSLSGTPSVMCPCFDVCVMLSIRRPPPLHTKHTSHTSTHGVTLSHTPTQQVAVC